MTALLCFVGILSDEGSRAQGRGDNVCAGFLFDRGVAEEEEIGLIAYLPIPVTSLQNNHWSSPAICSDSR